jgi:hypothetical protein
MTSIGAPPNQLLREELDRITEDYAGSDEQIVQQIDLIESLTAKFNHTIRLVRARVPGERIFTCYQYSLSVHDSEALQHAMLLTPFLSFGRDFMKYLIDTRLKEIAIQDVNDGDHVVYSNSSIQHAGKVAAGKVESKWGRAHLWSHGVFEVPQNYGSTVRFFSRIDQEAAVDAFLEYAKLKSL